MSSKHIFPLILEGAAAVVAATGAIPVNTSLVKLNPGAGDVSYTLPDGTVVGQVMVLLNINASNNDANVTVTSAFDAEYDSIALDSNNASATLIWNGSAWVLVAGAVAAAIA